MKQLKPNLGDLEREVMRLVWEHGPITADALRERLSRPLKESTVRTVLRRLEEKQYLTHTVDNRTFIYTAAEAREQMAAKAVKRIVDWFCDGAVEDVLVGMVDSSGLTTKQLDALAKRIEEAKRARTKLGRK
jgi:BlaI family transcriptional regulator, penicillinase repressor